MPEETHIQKEALILVYESLSSEGQQIMLRLLRDRVALEQKNRRGLSCVLGRKGLLKSLREGDHVIWWKHINKFGGFLKIRNIGLSSNLGGCVYPDVATSLL